MTNKNQHEDNSQPITQEEAENLQRESMADIKSVEAAAAEFAAIEEYRQALQIRKPKK